jgi:hypothetical protein
LPDYSLSGGQVSGRKDAHGAFAGNIKAVHLADVAKLVGPGIGARIGNKDQPLADPDGNAISQLISLVILQVD